MKNIRKAQEINYIERKLINNSPKSNTKTNDSKSNNELELNNQLETKESKNDNIQNKQDTKSEFNST
jgi:hypothetical protein